MKQSTLAELKSEIQLCKKKHGNFVISGQIVEYAHLGREGGGHEWYLSREEALRLAMLMKENRMGK